MNLTILRSTAAIAFLAIGVIGCSDTPTNPTPTEFVAADADFAGFTAWEQTTAPLSGPDPLDKLKGAHEELDPTVSRRVYVNKNGVVRGSNGQFPVGTIFVKQMKTASDTVRMTLAMSKRGNGFNAGNGDWEWFMLDPAGKIIERSATLMSGMCNGCHTEAKSTDYVFKVPTP